MLIYIFSSRETKEPYVKPEAAAAVREGPFSATLHLLSWNLDGLNKTFNVERAGFVCQVIRERKPEVVYLQEIVESTWQQFQSMLGSFYYLYRDEERAAIRKYYCILLIRKQSAILPESSAAQVIKFPQSRQGRHLIQMPVKFGDIHILLLTSHLESLDHFSAERKNQLKTCFSLMKEALQNQFDLCIFGGDMNLFNYELDEVGGLPEHFFDAWEQCGSDSDHKYTWDSFDPQFRFDRLFYCFQKKSLVPSVFELIGSKPLPECNGMCPSDHLGIWAEFELK